MGEAPDGPGDATVSFARDIQPIFDGHCIGCHRPLGEADLDLRASVSYDNLVNRPSRNYPPALRVVPGDPTNSVMFGKVSDSGQFGGPMPQPGGGSPPVPPEGIEKIRTWILEGAPEN
jgi:hypothetical protein